MNMSLLYRYVLDCSNMSEALSGVTVVVSLYRSPLDAGYQQMIRSMVDRGLLDRGFLVCLHSLFHGKFIMHISHTPCPSSQVLLLTFPRFNDLFKGLAIWSTLMACKLWPQNMKLTNQLGMSGMVWLAY